jgi:predicted CXXCH cytochrome family protein
MRVLPLLGVTCSVLASTVSAMAQHPSRTEAIEISVEYSNCAMCHETHSQSATAYSLRVSEIPVVVSRNSPGTTQLGSITRSCVRCHLTGDLRDRQPGFAGSSSSSSSGSDSYLGLDLRDDHPLGQLNLALATGHSSALPVRALERSELGSTRPPLGAATQDVECTTCHDPHRRTGSVPTPEEQRLLCTGCHEPGGYSLRSHSSLACSDCHSLHGGTEVALLAEPVLDLLCNSCHDPSGVPLGTRAHRPELPQAPSGHDRSLGESCLGCHEAHR